MIKLIIKWYKITITKTKVNRKVISLSPTKKRKQL